jgi:hypothetical protein
MVQVVASFAVVAFWLFIAIVSVTAIMYDYRKKQLAVDTLRHAIEHGQHLDPALLDRLLSHPKYADAREQVQDPRQLKIGGGLPAGLAQSLQPQGTRSVRRMGYASV